MVIRDSVALTVALILCFSLTPSVHSQDFELPVTRDRVDKLHRTLSGNMTDEEFDKACTAEIMKPPRWFLQRRSLAALDPSSWKHIGPRIFQFNDKTPTTIVRNNDLKQVRIYGDTWDVDLNIPPKSFLGHQRMAPSVTMVAAKVRDTVVVLGDLDYYPLAALDLSGQSRWTSRLHRISGYSLELNIEGFEKGEEITFFSADNRGEELSIESFDRASGKVTSWWSSKYRR